MSVPRPIVLLILDGFGDRKETEDNAIKLAKTPEIDALYAKYPHATIGTSGPDVGLPPGQMGNSEVGHLNFGAGRVAMMDISRIDMAVHEQSLGKNQVIANVISTAKARGGKLHLLGLVSDGGVHSMNTHLYALIEAAREAGVAVVVHAFLDGRDVAPGTAPRYLAELEAKLVGKGTIGSVSGRFFAMDRDNRWERVERAYRAIVDGTNVSSTSTGEHAHTFASAVAGTEASLAAGKGDEFVEPFVVSGYTGVAQGKDTALFFNFRPDRAREITRALAVTAFDGFARTSGAPFDGTFACMTTYDITLGLPIAFGQELHPDILPEVLSKAGKTQFRCAETEKYAHVTFFFNGGREAVFPGEDRKVIPSPKEVATYDLKPEMSLAGVVAATCEAIRSKKYDFVLVNFANPDMVGHTGVLEAAIRAIAAVDHGVGEVVRATLEVGGALFVTADHGNAELMRDPVTKMPHTAHTTNRVPLIYVDADERTKGVTVREGGRICDVAPTLLELFQIAVPHAMTGASLLVRGQA
jgi:2,3-bisphosphoglycerate-independent phosphoglycerate mutase